MSTPLTDITVVLDASGSMRSTLKSTISGYNEFLKTQKEDQSGRCTFSLLTFEGYFRPSQWVFEAKKIQDTEELTASTYKLGGMTPLYDAIGNAISSIEARTAALKRRKKKSPDKVIVLIITDGLENSSREYNSNQINTMITEKQEQGWDFVFIGANQDSIKTARAMGISQKSSLTYAQNDVGTRQAFASASVGTMSVRNAVAAGEESSYEFVESDRKRQYKQGARDELFESTGV